MTPNLVMPLAPIVYPDSDGKPMAENTLQYQWIVTLRENIAAQYADRNDVLVAADNLIYPEEGNPRLCTAPDVYVAFGRPPGHRGSYKVWEEGDTFPQVIFEVLSPNNTQQEMNAKRTFYRRHGAEEYYLIDPDNNSIEIRLREGRGFPEVDDVTTFVSPRLGIRFNWNADGELVVFRADGTRFRTWQELEREYQESASQAQQEKERAEHEKQRAEHEKQRAEHEKQRAEHEKQRADRLAAKLRELGLDPEGV
ncbi:MAG: Uma2 family endonuclease [Fimbriiglobus sp.]|jgi:Uma2 family endonuclease|nr:Uma2 family endonuclease [Fimbriiglobus sp.]